MANSEKDLQPSSPDRVPRAFQELGRTEGRNVHFEVRWSCGDINRVRTFAAELVKLEPDVIFRTDLRSRGVETSDPIDPDRFVVVNDPVAQGLIASVVHPGGNIRVSAS